MRIAHTSFGFRGRFWPISRPLFQGRRSGAGDNWCEGIQVSITPTLPPHRQPNPDYESYHPASRLPGLPDILYQRG